MKKVWLVVALTALCSLATTTFADVQNIRLSGDIRVRGYYLDDAGVGNKGDATFISQRTRVCVEADLEDHVLVVVTLKAEGLWGQDDASFSTSGAGSQQKNFNINRSFDLGLNEAYVQLSEVFYSPATLKLGRQYLNYGHGLILSSAEQEYNYDAARLVLDYYPLTLDIVGAQLVNNQKFSSTGSHAGASDLLFINARYEMSDSALKDLECYFGYVSQGGTHIAPSRVPPTVVGGSPLIVGVRGDLNPADAVKMWFEGAYEFGSDGAAPSGTINAWLVNVGASFSAKDKTYSPKLNVNYTYASGGGSGGRDQFRPWFDYADGYNGYVFAPALSNIHIINAGASVKPCENTTLSLQGYYYAKADDGSQIGSNPNVDFGGLGYTTVGSSRDVGWELDAILGYDYSKDVRMQFVYGAFIPSGAIKDAGNNRTAQEVRGEVSVKF